MSVDLRQWLQAAAILTGQQNGQTSGSTNPASSLIATRLIEAHAAIPGRSTDAAALETLNEDALRLRAGYLAYEISVNLHSISKSLPLSDAPTFSVADTQSLQLLGGVLAGWGIAPYCDRGLLSSQAAVPLPDCSDEIRVQRLQERIQGCLDCVLPQASMQPSTSTNTLPSPQEQLADILLKPCLFAIYPGLIELAFKLQLPWAQQKIKVFFQCIKMDVNMKNLLQLMSLASNVHAVWAIKSISTFLSSRLRQPNGIYTLLSCMIQPENPDPSPQLLERITRLILAAPPDWPRSEHFSLVVRGLLNIVSSKPNTLSSGVIRGACYVLSRIVLARHRSALPHLLGAFFIQSGQSASADVSLDQTIISSSAVHNSIQSLSVWLQNAPPSHLLADVVLRPHMGLLLSLFSYLKTAEDPSTPKTSLFKTDLSLLSPLIEVLTLWLQRTDVSYLINTLQLASASLHDQDARYRLPEGSFWTADAEGQPCVKVKSDPQIGVAFEGDSQAELLSVHPEILIKFIGSAGTNDLKAALMLRWLGEVELTNDPSCQVSPAQSFFTMQLLSQSIEDWGPETLEKPEDALSFVAFALRERPQELEDPTEAVSLEDLSLDEESTKDLTASALRSQLPALGLTYLSFLLQAHRSFSPQCQRMVDMLVPRVKSLTSSSDPNLAAAAADVQHLLDMRSTAEKVGKAPKVSDDPYEPSREKFKEALELLQDPILPIKAAGVDILRTLITVDPTKTDPTLWPEIKQVLISALGNDDSYLYQRAAQCLTDLCLLKPQAQGAAIAKDLTKLYAEQPENILLPRDLDRRLRFGEALSSLVRASGTAIALYVDSLVPTLLSVIRNPQQPTIMRASSLTCLGDCVQSSVLALLPYLDSDLVELCLSILQVESRGGESISGSTEDSEATPAPVDVDKIFDEELEKLRPESVRQSRRPEETANPLTVDAKEQPSLRRAACFFIASLALANQEQSVITTQQREQIITVMRYVGQTDMDPLVRHQAQEVLEVLGYEDTAHRLRAGNTLL